MIKEFFKGVAGRINGAAKKAAAVASVALAAGVGLGASQDANAGVITTGVPGTTPNDNIFLQNNVAAGQRLSETIIQMLPSGHVGGSIGSFSINPTIYGNGSVFGGICSGKWEDYASIQCTPWSLFGTSGDIGFSTPYQIKDSSFVVIGISNPSALRSVFADIASTDQVQDGQHAFIATQVGIASNTRGISFDKNNIPWGSLTDTNQTAFIEFNVQGAQNPGNTHNAPEPGTRALLAAALVAGAALAAVRRRKENDGGPALAA